MKRSAFIWFAFSMCLAVVLAALAWTSVNVLRLERQASQAQANAALEEDVRLALWRMESALAAVFAQENSRPYFWYSAFYAADRPYTRMFTEPGQHEGLLASPLLDQTPPHVLLHFQMAADGTMLSPQAPQGWMLELARGGALPSEKLVRAAERLERLRGTVRGEVLRAALPADEPQSPPLAVVVPPQMAQNRSRRMPDAQQNFNTIEYQARAQASLQQNNDFNNTSLTAPLDDVSTGVVHPLWIGGNLLLVRRVKVNQDEYLQGCWLDWPALSATLLAGVRDLLPDARLTPGASAATNRERMLAALPAALSPGSARSAELPDTAGLTPLKLSLATAWGGTLVAALAVAALLLGVMQLSERRAAFVSAVTHELRTPLTTFRMYAEMLAENMVPDETTRRRYVQTLRLEAERLSHLVENVLAYAQLERASRGGRVERVPLAELLARVTPRLRERAEQAEMRLHVAPLNGAAGGAVQADSAAVEQILFNLVDNACKYACPHTGEAAGGAIYLEAEPVEGRMVLRVRDEGPGISQAGARRLFRPFSKTAHEAAVTAPGVGLGLALSRRLARAMGGDLRLEAAGNSGATFALRLPAAPG